MFNRIQSFVNDKINKSTNRKCNHNFYIYLGNPITDTIMDINISKERFITILNILSNCNLKGNSFSKDKYYYINNTCYVLNNKKIRSHSIEKCDYHKINKNISIIYQLEKSIPTKDFYSCDGYNHIEHREVIKLRYNFIEIYLNHILADNKNKESYNVYFKFNDKNYSESILNIIDIIKLLEL